MALTAAAATAAAATTPTTRKPVRYSPHDIGSANRKAAARASSEARPSALVSRRPRGVRVSAWTAAAWRTCGRTGELWHATLTPGYHRAWAGLSARVGLWMVTPPQPPETPDAELSAQVLSRELLDRKHRALQAHESQTRARRSWWAAETYRRWWSTESFVAVEGRAASRAGGPA